MYQQSNCDPDKDSGDNHDDDVDNRITWSWDVVVSLMTSEKDRLVNLNFGNNSQSKQGWS